MDSQMDFEPDGCEGDSIPGVRRINRVIATYDGHTHIYQYPPSESHRAATMIKLHVEEGTLHPYAGIMLIRMVKNGH